MRLPGKGLVSHGVTKARILVVDDDPQLLDLLVDTLTAIGYDTTPAPGGPEALDQLKTESFDLVVTDIKMPDVDGLTLLRKIRRHHNHLPVLVITGVASPDLVGRAGPDGFLTKPFRFSQIEQLIEQTLKQAKLSRARRQPRILFLGFSDILDPEIVTACNRAGLVHFHAPDQRRAKPEFETGRFDAIIIDPKTIGDDVKVLLDDARRHQVAARVYLHGKADLLQRSPWSSVPIDGLCSSLTDPERLRRLVSRPEMPYVFEEIPRQSAP